MGKSCSSLFSHSRDIYLSSCNSIKRKLRPSKVVEIQVFKYGGTSELFPFQTRVGFLTLKAAEIENDYLHPMARGGHILNTNQLRNIEPLFNTNQQLFLKKITPFIIFQRATKEIHVFQKHWRAVIFFSWICKRKDIRGDRAPEKSWKVIRNVLKSHENHYPFDKEVPKYCRSASNR